MKKLVLTVILLITVIALNAQTIILHGNNATSVELNSANDLKADIQKVYPNELVNIQSSKKSIKGKYNRIIVKAQKNQII